MGCGRVGYGRVGGVWVSKGRVWYGRRGMGK